MDKYNARIIKESNKICANIEKREVLEDDGLLSQNILASLRNLIEAIIFKVYSLEHEVDFNLEGLRKAVKFVKSKDDMSFLSKFHSRLEVTDSHQSVEPEAALRLIWRYYEDLLKCREFLKEKFNLDTLDNIENLPLEEDETLKEYYEKIAEKIKNEKVVEITESPTHRFYINKKKRFKVGDEIFYELTLSEASYGTSKFDRIIAFTKINIPSYYAVHLRIKTSRINIINRNMPINIIVGFKVSTRPCEFDNYFKILGHKTKISTSDAEYRELMTYLTQTKRNLTELLELDDDDFTRVKGRICTKLKSTPIFDGLQLCRMMYDKPGYNILVYLLYRLSNDLIKAQFNNEKNERLSWLYLKYESIPFDSMPFSGSLYGYNTNINDLYDCISPIGREHELLGRKIRTNTENLAQLYTPISELSKFSDLEKLVQKYNNCLYYKHRAMGSLKIEYGYMFLSGYEKNSVDIITRLLELSKEKVDEYTESVNDWLENSAYVIDDEDKKRILQNLFSKSKVSLIYGSAGTGKSTMIKHISHFFSTFKKLYLANTHSAVENLRRNIGNSENNNFSTIKSHLKSSCTEVDILFVDECSTVSNEDMAKILFKTKFKLIVLVGDIYQIESIKFGNWFYIAKFCMPQYCVNELTYVHRSTESGLKDLWKSVRNLEDTMSDIMELNHYCAIMNDEIFEKVKGEDEVVLCLNYDGLYGINNLNKFLQDNQEGKSIKLGLEQYRVGDPIVFKESDKFGDYLYNNLKGSIVDIVEFDREVEFTLEVNRVFNSFQVESAPFEKKESKNKGKSIIRFKVSKFSNKDDDERNKDNIVPFQVAYAVSIHRAQGLEYDSVKIVITDDMEDLITHNIFYTAITRAKKKLKIFWTKKAEQNILGKMKRTFNDRDASILCKKFNL